MIKFPFRNLVFQGGGIKALAYHGALRVLEGEGVLPQIERVAGASAGAAMAMFVAMRLPVDEIIEVYKSFDYEQITVARSSRMPDQNSNPSFLQRELERVQNSFTSVTRLATKFGWYSSEYGYRWMQDIVARYCHGNGRATFAQFRQRKFRDLYIIVTNLTTHATEIFSADTTPDAAVVDAALMSQALPLFFEAVQFDGKRIGQGDHYLDGGLLTNYPLQLFDERPFAGNNRWFVNGINWETLGCRTFTPEDCPPRSGAIRNLLTYAQNVFEVLIEAQAEAYRLNKPAQRRSIDISDCCIRTTDWDVRPDLDDPRYLKLVSAGETAALSYLDNYIPPVIKPLLPFSWYLDRRWRAFNKWLQTRG
ncbi:MAG: patatin-like phospholipase family protein [Candidatus Promineifilaceae bacterium]|nr:patatin-like phospholipase family protein [Candidatus Promineifilaceae bacterium]